MTQAITLDNINLQLLMAMRAKGIINGTGPGSWKVCGFKFKSWFTLPTPHGHHDAEAHDLAYTIGGTEQEREEQDLLYRDRLTAQAKKEWFLSRWFLKREARTFWHWLAEAGKSRWHYGTPRDEAALWRLAGGSTPDAPPPVNPEESR